MKRWGYTIFSDDVRYEVGGKVSFMGVYTGQMAVFTAFPLSLPRLCLFITYNEVWEEDVRPFTIKVLLGTAADTVLFESEVSQSHGPTNQVPTAPDSQLLRSHRVPVIFNPLQIPEPTHLRVRAYCGDETVRLGSLYINQATPELRSQLEVQTGLKLDAPPPQ